MKTQIFISLLIQAVAGYFDYHMQQTIHSTFNNNPNYLPWNYEYSDKKLFIQATKSLFYNLAY